jgi:NAD(P) transhydrogenase subunit alpha
MTESLITAILIFTLASFTGFEIINKVPPTLHTPLMSGSNAISGICVIGAVLVAGAELDPSVSTVLGVVAIACAMVNVVGGFLVTDRMLQMFKKKES